MSLSSISVSISDSHDGGNIKYIRQEPNRNDPNVLDVVLEIKPDVYTELEQIAHMQYFSFRAMIQGMERNGGPPQRIKYIIANAEETSYPEAWSGSTVFYTDNLEDSDSWKRNQDTFYTEGKLHWEQIHDRNGSFYFSYFPLYSYARHLHLIGQCSKYTAVESLGKSLDGREIECVTVGKGPLTAWIIHRQHPGESMAEHYAEGLLKRLLGLDNNGDVQQDAAVVKALENFTFYIVPCMCPDGSVRGHLRTNACGANLNREWCTKGNYEAPTLHRSPEVYCVLKKMDETGVDCFLDIHGDEELPFNFLSGAAMVPNWGPRLQGLHGAFAAAYTRSNPDMQLVVGYPPLETTEQVMKYMNVATNQICHRFDCLAVTLEMPFKDCLTNPDPMYGWSPKRSRELGASVLEALLYVHPHLRAEDDFWTRLPAEDAYVATTNSYEVAGDEAEDEQFTMIKKHSRMLSDVHEIRKKYSPQTVLPTFG